jgi:mono/diheme cytochrome c family protein
VGKRALLWPCILLTGVFAWLPVPLFAADPGPKELFETNCSACHTLELPKSQRLDRKTWRWVVDDMVNQFGATWITPEQQRLIIDYLAENYGPDRPVD